MKVATTIQISFDEDQEIETLKSTLGLPSKKAVVIEGLRTLRSLVEERHRRHRLQSLSERLRRQSQLINKEWAPLSTASKVK